MPTTNNLDLNLTLLPSPSLTQPLKSYLPNRKVVFQPSFFKGYVKLWEGSLCCSVVKLVFRGGFKIIRRQPPTLFVQATHLHGLRVLGGKHLSMACRTGRNTNPFLRCSSTLPYCHSLKKKENLSSPWIYIFSSPFHFPKKITKIKELLGPLF